MVYSLVLSTMEMTVIFLLRIRVVFVLLNFDGEIVSFCFNISAFYDVIRFKREVKYL